MAQPLSTDLDDPEARPYFLWDRVSAEDPGITVRQLRQHLAAVDPEERALWIARVMREARYQDVWRFVALADVLALWSRIEKHLGRTRAFWQWLLQGWRDDGLIPRAE
jgi:hypothetical protein